MSYIDIRLDRISQIKEWNNEIQPIKHIDPFYERARDKCIVRNKQEINKLEIEIKEFLNLQNGNNIKRTS